MLLCYTLDVTSKGVGASSVSQESLATEEELKVARDLGRQLSDASVKYYKELSSAFDEKTSQIGASFWDINYDAFSVICSNVLRRTIDSVSNRWDQTLLVFAGYNQLREALHGDAIRLNEVSSYIGRYLSDMGFQSWIQLQGGWVSNVTHFCCNSLSLCIVLIETCGTDNSWYK